MKASQTECACSKRELGVGTSQGCLALNDPDQIVTTHIDWPNTTFLAAGKHATLALLKIETMTVATQPADRARKTVGVCEEVILTLEPKELGLVPWSIASPAMGKLQFIFSNGDDLYTAPSRTFTLGNQSLIETITATVNGGATSTDLHVIEPTGILIKNSEVFACWIPPYSAQIGIFYMADIYVRPDSVNFYRIKLHEGDSSVLPSGYFTTHPHEMGEHISNGPHLMTQEVIAGKGTRCQERDQIQGAINISPPYESGELSWSMLWQYSPVNDETRWSLDSVSQTFSLSFDATNRPTLIVSKDQSGYRIVYGADEVIPLNP